MINVLLADDHQIFLDGLNLILSREKDDIRVVAETLKGSEVLSLVRVHQPDVVVLDIGMPDLSGIEVAKLLQVEYPKIPVLILTTHDQPDFVEDLLNADVQGYIMKNRGAEQLVKAIHELNAGKTYFGQEILKVIRDSKRKQEEIKNVKLTKREEEVLRLIAREFTTPEIADKLFIAASTVETHRRNLIAKFGVKGTLGLVRKAVEMGIG